MMEIPDPLAIAGRLWPDVTFYREQKEIIYSVWDNKETYVYAGNKLGKDFVAGFIVLVYFLSRYPCKIVTTSVKEKHLDILWGEVAKFLRTSKYPLVRGEERTIKGVKVVGESLIFNNDGLRRVWDGEVRRDSYAIKLVANEASIESFQGHHVTPDPGQPIDNVPRNLFIADEASGLLDSYYQMVTSWAERILVFGNPWPCNNFFYRAVKGNPKTGVKGGDLPRESGKGYRRKTIQIKAEHSPNVRLGLIQADKGKTPTDEILIPGVKGYGEYIDDRKYWDKIQQCVSLDAEFYEGEEIKLFPADRMVLASTAAGEAGQRYGARRKGRTIGCDPGEGTANTSWTVGDEHGFIEQINKKTIDTSVIVDVTVRLMREYGVTPENVLFDRGGGGKQHADSLRRSGYNVRTVGFGETVTPERRSGETKRVNYPRTSTVAG